MSSPNRPVVLCATDLSAAGDAAVPLAFALAGAGGTLHLLTVCEPGYLLSPFDLAPVVVAPAATATQERVEARALQHLERLVAAHRGAGDRQHRIHVVHDVDPAAVIQRVAREVGADTIVMGTHGRSGLGRLLMGSVATEVLRRASTAVVLARPGRPSSA